MLIRLLIGAGLLLLLIWAFVPREPAQLRPVQVDLPGDLPGDLTAWLATREAGIAPDLAARIDWAGAAGQQTDLALVYLHGFSASPAELQPVPERVAAGLGANLYVARLTGHAQGGEALAGARLTDWWRDTAEAVAIGQRIGRRVVLMGTSTGATLAAEAARDPVLGQGIDAVVLISPNFGLRNRAAGLLRWPLARWWVPLVAGKTRCFQPVNAAHATGWTSCYPTVATLPMAALVGHARRGDYRAARQPVLMIWSKDDQVIDPRFIAPVADTWSGKVAQRTVTPGPGDDPSRHVIAGDILSPGMTQAVARMIQDWLQGALAP